MIKMKNKGKLLWKYRFPESLILRNQSENKIMFWKVNELLESRRDLRNIILYPLRMIHIDGTCLTASIGKRLHFNCFLERLFWSLI